MRLYHGTTETVARKALTEGLRPRVLTGSEGNWEGNPSEEWLVYLTETYAAYFGFCATSDGMDENIGIVEIDTDLLDVDNMRPDEDFLEQANRMGMELPDFLQEDLNECADMQERTAWFKARLSIFAELWDDSVTNLGNAAHFGSIPPEAIVRVAVFDPKSNPLIFQTAMDPSISILNFRFMADKYRAVTSWLMGNKVSVQEFYGQIGAAAMLLDANMAKQMAKGQTYLDDQSGLEIIENKKRKQDAA